MSRFEPRDADFRTRVRDSFARQAFMETIGASLAEVGPGRAKVVAPCSAHVTQQQAYVHGGVLGALAETAAGCAAGSLMSAGDSVETVEYKLNLLAPAKAGKVVARAAVIRPGRTLTIVRSDVYSVADGNEELCASAVVTLIRIAAKGGDSGG